MQQSKTALEDADRAVSLKYSTHLSLLSKAKALTISGQFEKALIWVSRASRNYESREAKVIHKNIIQVYIFLLFEFKLNK